MFRYKGSCGSYRLKVDIQLSTPQGTHPKATPGHHNADFFPEDEHMKTAFFDPAASNPNIDTTSAYSQGLVGFWGWVDPATVAHETGHLLGLGDDYVRGPDGKVIPGAVYDGREKNTLMTGHATRITQKIVDRI